MKKSIATWVLAVCCLTMAVPAQAQLLKFGVKGGLNMSKLDLDIKNVASDNTTGFYIGPMAEFTIPIIGLGVDGAVMYSQRGKNDWKQQGLEIPVNLKYTLGLGSVLGIYLAVGPDFFFNFNDIELRGWDIKTNKTQVGLNLGAGVKLLKHLQIGVNYQLPMGESFTIKQAGETLKDELSGEGKTKTWQVSLAYLF